MEYSRLFKEGESNSVAGNTFETLEEVLNWVPQHDSYEYCDGGKNNEDVVILLLDSGREISLKRASEHSHGSNHTPTTRWDALPIKAQIEELERKDQGVKDNIVAIVARNDYSCTWEDDECLEDDGIFIPFNPIDWTKVQRRVEDRIRKDKVAMKKTAFSLNVKLY